MYHVQQLEEYRCVVAYMWDLWSQDAEPDRIFCPTGVAFATYLGTLTQGLMGEVLL